MEKLKPKSTFSPLPPVPLCWHVFVSLTVQGIGQSSRCLNKRLFHLWIRIMTFSGMLFGTAGQRLQILVLSLCSLCISDDLGNSSVLFLSFSWKESLCATSLRPSAFFFVPFVCSLCCKLLQSWQPREMLLGALWPPIPPLLFSAPTTPLFSSPRPAWLPLALVDLLLWTGFSLNSCQSPYDDLQRDLRAWLLKGWFQINLECTLFNAPQTVRDETELDAFVPFARYSNPQLIIMNNRWKCVWYIS